MIFLFVLLLHAPKAVPNPHDRFVAETYRHSFRKPAYRKGYGESDTKDVDDYANDHSLKIERTFGGGREGYDDAVHEEVNGDAVQNTAHDGVLIEEAPPAAHHKVNSSDRKRDEEVTQKTKQGRFESAFEGTRPQ